MIELGEVVVQGHVSDRKEMRRGRGGRGRVCGRFALHISKRVEENLVYAEILWSQMTKTRHGFSLKSGFR